MRSFRLKIKCGGDAMRSRDDVADALAAVANRVREYGAGDTLDYGFDYAIRDVNGNTVGTWRASK